MKILSKDFKSIALENLKIVILTTLIETFCMFSLSTFQSKGHNQNFFHAKDIQKMSPSVQTLIDDFKNFVITKVDLEYRDNSTLIELLPHLVNQDSKSDVKDK